MNQQSLLASYPQLNEKNWHLYTRLYKLHATQDTEGQTQSPSHSSIHLGLIHTPASTDEARE